jgi:proteasome lid subunit RPN8/RPN11
VEDNREMTALRIAREAWEAMVAHAVAAYPEECCGAMLGAGGEVRLAVPLANAAESRRTRYAILPEELLAATREARDRGLKIAGIYHSHPDGEAGFSETDLKNCCPWYAFLVLSVRNGVFAGAACWQPDAAQTAAVQVALDRPL